MNIRKQNSQKINGKNIIDGSDLKNIDHTSIAVVVTAYIISQQLKSF